MRGCVGAGDAGYAGNAGELLVEPAASLRWFVDDSKVASSSMFQELFASSSASFFLLGGCCFSSFAVFSEFLLLWAALLVWFSACVSLLLACHSARCVEQLRAAGASIDSKITPCRKRHRPLGLWRGKWACGSLLPFLGKSVCRPLD